MLIASRPEPNLGAILIGSQNIEATAHSPLFFNLGREALLYGIKAMGIKSNEKIIIPSFMCESTIKPLISQGYKIILVDINEELNYNMTELKKAIRIHKPVAIMAVHFFGFPCNIIQIHNICQRFKIKLIEDCSHSNLTQFNGKPLGHVGDMAIYSFRKNLPVSDGGCLSMAHRPHMDNLSKHSTSAREISYLMARMAEKLACSIGWPNIYGHRINTFKTSIRLKFQKGLDGAAIKQMPLPRPPSRQLKGYLGNKNYLENCARKIRDNFFDIIQIGKNAGLEALYNDAPQNVVPQWAIFLDKSGRLSDQLRHRGIGASQWPAAEIIPTVRSAPKKYPVANMYNSELLLIPVHQTISKKQKQFINKILCEVSSVS